MAHIFFFFFFSSRRRHTRSTRDWRRVLFRSFAGDHLDLIPPGRPVWRLARTLGRGAEERSDERRVGKESRARRRASGGKRKEWWVVRGRIDRTIQRIEQDGGW